MLIVIVKCIYNWYKIYLILVAYFGRYSIHESLSVPLYAAKAQATTDLIYGITDIGLVRKSGCVHSIQHGDPHAAHH